MEIANTRPTCLLMTFCEFLLPNATYEMLSCLLMLRGKVTGSPLPRVCLPCFLVNNSRKGLETHRSSASPNWNKLELRSVRTPSPPTLSSAPALSTPHTLSEDKAKHKYTTFKDQKALFLQRQVKSSMSMLRKHEKGEVPNIRASASLPHFIY